MKFVNRFLSLFVFIAAIVGTMDTAHSRCNKTLTNGWGGEWKPFVLGTPDKASGLDMEILEAVVVGIVGITITILIVSIVVSTLVAVVVTVAVIVVMLLVLV